MNTNTDGTPADDGSVMEAAARPDTETTVDDDLDEQSSRLSTDRDDSPADEDEDEDGEQQGDTFPRPYVERLRARSAGYRTRATAAEARTSELETALFTERVRALDMLADPGDLPYDADLLDDPDALRAAAEALVSKRPHYRRRGTTSGQQTGHRDGSDRADTVSLTGIMRGHM